MEDTPLPLLNPLSVPLLQLEVSVSSSFSQGPTPTQSLCNAFALDLIQGAQLIEVNALD